MQKVCITLNTEHAMSPVLSIKYLGANRVSCSADISQLANAKLIRTIRTDKNAHQPRGMGGPRMG